MTNREILDRLFDEIVWRFNEFNEFKELYYHSDSRINLIQSCLKEFGSDLFYMYIEKITLGVSRLIDPVKSESPVVFNKMSDRISFSISLKGFSNKPNNKKRNETLSVYYVDRVLRKSEANYPITIAAHILKQIEDEVGCIKKLRNKVFAHNDLKTALSDKELLFFPSKVEVFYNLCHRYLELIFNSLYSEPCPIKTNGNVDYLITALKGYKVSEALFFNNIEKYDELESTMQLDDA